MCVDPYLQERCVLSYHPTATQNLTREQEPAAGPSFLSGANFPELGAHASLSKEQKSKVRDSNQREANAPLFREAYHAQLREVHGGNMRAVEAMERDEEELPGNRRNRAVDRDTINSVVESVIREISADGELVTKEKVSVCF